MQRILVPVDFSKPSRSAFDYALALAKSEKASLLLVHAMHLPADLRTTGEWWASVRAAATVELAQLQDVAEEAGVDIQTVIVNERAVEAINEMARERAVDLVVVGSRGHGALQHTLLGRVATRVVALAPCPVLTVPRADVVPSVGGPVKLEQILVATDFSESADTALRWAVDIARSHGSTLHLLSALQVDFLGRAVFPQKLIDDFHDSTRERLEQEAATLREANLEVLVHAVWETPASAIIDTAASIDADLIAMGTRGRTGLANVLLGSVAERVIHSAPCPVVTLSADGDAGSAGQ